MPLPQKSLTLKTFQIYWQHAKKYKWQVAGLLFFLTVSVIAETAGPFLYKQFINLLASGDYSKQKALLGILTIIIIVRAVRSYSYRLKDYFTIFLETRVMANLTNTCYEYLQQNSYNFFSGNFVGSLVNKVKKYERGFETVVDRLTDDFIRTFLAISFSVGVLAFRHWALALALLLWCVIYIGTIYSFSMWKLKYDLQKAELETRITGVLADSITNNINIKLFSAFGREKKAFENINEEHFRLRRFSWNLMTYLELVQGTLMLGLELLMMYLAIKFWAKGMLSVGDFTLIQLYLISIFDKLWSMGKQVRAFYEALADSNEMTEILEEPHEVVDAKTAKALKSTTGKIEFENVNFAYQDGSNVLENFKLTIEPKQRVALIGPSGGGKSTIVKILLRFIDIQGGKILIDGQDIAKVTQDSLRQTIALVPQEPILFHRTLMENIRYGKPNATDAEVILAAKQAHAHEFISKFQKGYNMFVGERGVKLSGGERQRVAIARAILKDAPILVLDEATSSLDSESESLIQDALKNLMKDKTVIVIAHRLSTIMQMDRIIVLEKGKITEEGKHKELLKMEEGTYQKLWQIQAGGFA